MSLRNRTVSLISALTSCAVWASTPAAQASERHFTYTYESEVLKPGALALDPWTTWRFGRQHYYSRFDQRLEFEFGVAENLETALFWNFAAVTADSVDPATGELERQSETQFQSVSSKWKYKVSDAATDALGSAFFLEASLGPAQAGIEAKLILDKRLDRLLFAANLLGAHEWAFKDRGDAEREIELALVLAGGFLVTETFMVGLEADNVTILESGDMVSSVIHAGPALAVGLGHWWSALTVMPQLTALHGASDESTLDLEHHEKLEVRMILGFHL